MEDKIVQLREQSQAEVKEKDGQIERLQSQLESNEKDIEELDTEKGKLKT